MKKQADEKVAAQRREQDAQSRQKTADALRQQAEQKRQADLQIAARTTDQQTQRMTVPPDASCDYRKLVAIGNGDDPNGVICPNTARTQQQNGGASPTVALPQVQPQPMPTPSQLDYLRRNAVTLQPDPRHIPAPPATQFQVQPLPPPEIVNRPAENDNLGPFGPPTAEEKAAADAKAAAEAEKQRRDAASSPSRHAETESDDSDCKM